MKKNIIIAVLVTLTVLSFIFGLTQRTEAFRQRERAELNAQQAVEFKESAHEQMELAAIHRMEAEHQRQIAIECASKK